MGINSALDYSMVGEGLPPHLSVQKQLCGGCLSLCQGLHLPRTCGPH